METELIKARILSRMQDDLPQETIISETIADCDGDIELAHKFIVEIAKSLL